jgi:CheY-like chemotaxis protein
MLLRMHGHEVRVAYDGVQALRYAAASPPQVVLLDIGLPGMDGYEVARRLRLLAGVTQARMIAVTGYGQEQDLQAAGAAGFDGHLTKPVDPDQLLALLNG